MVSGTTTSSNATDSTATPGRSTSAAACRRSRGSTRRATAITAAQMGTLTKNTGRQLAPAMSALISAPPASCPTTAPAASAIVNRPIAWSRSRPVKCSWMPVSVCGYISAAPAPWATRMPTSRLGSGASPPASELAPKTANPARNSRL